MPETLKHYRTYIEEELLSGKSQQDVFNDAITKYDLKVHEIAEAIRKTPTLEKRIKYNQLNTILVVCMILNMALGLFFRINNIHEDYLTLFPGLMGLMLLYGLIKYKHPAHLLSCIILTVLSAISIIQLIIKADIIILLELLFNICITSLAYFLNNKFSADYIYHRDKVQNDPTLRIDSVTFIK